MKKPAIPEVPRPGDHRAKFDQSLKECVEIFKGDRGSGIKQLDPATATLEQAVLKINEILVLLQ